MPNSIKELTEKRQALVAAAKAITAKADEEKRNITEDEQRDFDAKEAEIATVTKEIDAANATADRQHKVAEMEKWQPSPEPRSRTGSLNEPPGEKRTLIPAGVARKANLKGFKGSDANERAYTSGQWILAASGREESRQWCRDHGLELRAQSSNNNFLGGYAVIPEFSQAMIDLREQYGVFRQNARVVPMASDTLVVPRRDTGLTAYFVSDNPSSGITESDKSWSQVTLTARKLATLTRWSSELNDDAIISLADDLASEIAFAFAYQEDLCGFVGDGTSTYGGIQGVFSKINNGSYAGSIFTAATGNTAFGTLDLDDFEAAAGMLPLYARPGAKWFISPSGFASSMQRLAYAAGGSTKADIASGADAMFLGYPVVLSTVLNSTLTAQASTVVAVFGNLQKASMFGDRAGVSVDISTERYFEFDQLAIRGKQRFDIVVHDLGGASTAGPMIALKTPAS